METAAAVPVANATGAKEVLKGKSLAELEALVEQLGHKRYRAGQLYRWLYRHGAKSFEEMTDFGKEFRAQLEERYSMPNLRVMTRDESSDGTIKFLVGLPDGETVEAVYIPTPGRVTLCVSSQVGCKQACRFCATGYMKFTRHLHTWEIVDQLVALEFPRPVTNIVLMGMGEPFDNWDNVIAALRIFQDPNGPQIGKRHITVSTVGLVPRIQEFVDLNLGKLAISLHGTTDEQRSRLMPINRKYDLPTLLDACRQLKFKNQGRVTFEYILIDGENDSEEDAHRLGKILRGIPTKINLLAYNENPFVAYKRPPEERVLVFQRILLEAGYTVTYRRSRGRDIAAACGQLRTEVEAREAARKAKAAAAGEAIAISAP